MPFWYSPDDASAFYSVPPLVQPVEFMKRRTYSWWGVRVSCSIVLCIAVVALVRIAMAYNGTCGGFWPGLSASHPCSFWDHTSFYIILTVGILGIVYGPILLGILLVPPLVGYWLDRRRRASV
jgi:hypothetical protein